MFASQFPRGAVLYDSQGYAKRIGVATSFRNQLLTARSNIINRIKTILGKDYIGYYKDSSGSWVKVVKTHLPSNVAWNQDRLTEANFVAQIEVTKITTGWTGYGFTQFLPKNQPVGAKRKLEFSVNCKLRFRNQQWTCYYKLDKSKNDYAKVQEKLRKRGGVIFSTSMSFTLVKDKKNNYWLRSGAMPESW